MNVIKKRYKDEMRMLCRDIVRSKGQILQWSKTKQDVNDLVDSINTKISQGNKKEELETKKTATDSFEQLTFEF